MEVTLFLSLMHVLVNASSCTILQLYVRKWMQLTISSWRHLQLSQLCS